MRILITGVTGMVGSHLVDHVLANHADVEVHGLMRWRSPIDNIRHAIDRISVHLADLNDLGSLIRLLETVQPDRIFHLAAQSYVTTSFSAPLDTLRTNVSHSPHFLQVFYKFLRRLYVGRCKRVCGARVDLQVSQEKIWERYCSLPHWRIRKPSQQNSLGEAMLRVCYCHNSK